MSQRLKRDHFLSRLQEEPRKRVALETLTAIFLSVFDEFKDHPNYREPLATFLTTLADERVLVLPKGKHLWEMVGTPRLPVWVEIVIQNEMKEEVQPIAWLPELAPVAAQLRQRVQLRDLAKINAYLITNRGKLIPVPYRERSLKIFEDEHYMDQMVSKGHLFQGRLALDIVYAFEVGEPMPYERPPSLIIGKPLLIVENQHSFASFVHVNALNNVFSAVCFASGHTLASREYSLDGIGTKLETSKYIYLGDIDSSGLSIPIEVNATRYKRGVPLLKAANIFYTWILRNGIQLPVRKQQSPVNMSMVTEWFSYDTFITQEICALFSKNMRIPQECLGMEDLLQSDIFTAQARFALETSA